MRYEVPQFIDIEDKIFGPFTWRQFVYLAGGGGAVLILYFVIPFFAIFVILALPIMALTGFLAFHKVNNRPFALYLESVVKYFTGTKLYLWKRHEKQVIERRTPESIPVVKKPHDANAMQNLSRKLELTTINPNQLENEN